MRLIETIGLAGLDVLGSLQVNGKQLTLAELIPSPLPLQLAKVSATDHLGFQSKEYGFPSSVESLNRSHGNKN